MQPTMMRQAKNEAQDKKPLFLTIQANRGRSRKEGHGQARPRTHQALANVTNVKNRKPRTTPGDGDFNKLSKR